MSKFIAPSGIRVRSGAPPRRRNVQADANAPMARRIAAASALAFLAIPSGANAQLATSPDVVQVPPVSVTAPSEGTSKPLSQQAYTAPKAAQQTSTPRSARNEPAAQPAQTEASASEPSAYSVAPTGLTQPVEAAASSVSVITGSEIEARQTRNATDLLSTVPGLAVSQTGGPGGSSAVFIRGTNSNHTKVFIDGIDVTNPFDANRAFDFGLLSTFDIGRVEVLRGPQSGLYGADPIGGVVVVYTKDGDGPLKMDALIEGGSFGTLNEAVGARGTHNGLRYSFNASHQSVDGVTVTPRHVLLPGQRPLENGYENWTFSGKLGADVSPFLSFNVAARYTDSETTFQSDSFDLATFTSRPENALTRTSSDQLYTRGETILSLYGGRLKSIVGLNYTEVDSTTITPSSGTTAGVGTRVKTDWRTVAQVAPGVTLVTGGDWQNERLTQPGLAVEEESIGGYVQAQLQPVRNFFITGNWRRDDNENFGSATTWRVAPVAVIDATGTTFRASTGTAYKAPSLTQRYQDFPAFAFFANRNLRPEESRGMDIGFEQELFSGRARTGLTYFRNNITDLIEFVSDPATFTSTVENVGQARTSGIEVFFSADLSDTVRLRADYTYTEALNLKTHLDLLRRPRDKASLSLGWQPISPLLLTGTLLYVGERFDVDRVSGSTVDANGGRIRSGEYVTVNVAADYKVNEQVSLIGRIDNLLDERYEDPSGFLRPGLGAYAGVRLRN